MRSPGKWLAQHRDFPEHWEAKPALRTASPLEMRAGTRAAGVTARWPLRHPRGLQTAQNKARRDSVWGESRRAECLVHGGIYGRRSKASLKECGNGSIGVARSGFGAEEGAARSDSVASTRAAMGDGDGVDDRQAEAGASAAGGVGRALRRGRSGRRSGRASRPGCPGPLSATSTSASPPSARRVHRDRRALRRVASALSSRLRTRRWRSSGLPSIRGGRSLWMSKRRPPIGRRLGAASSAISARSQRRCSARRPASRWQARAGRRRAGSSAARSAAPSRPPRVFAWPGQLSRPPAARGWRGRWSAACAARARRRRRTRAASAAPPRARSAPCPASAASAAGFGQLADLVVGRRFGNSPRGVLGGRDFRAVAVSEAIGRIARLASARPARTASRVPAIMPTAMKSQSGDRRVTVLGAAGVLDVAG